MNDFNQKQSNISFPSNLEKIALLFAVIPFIFYNWNATGVATPIEGISNLYALIGGIVAISFVPLIFLLEFRKLPQEERMKHLILIVFLDAVSIIHILYGCGIFG